MVYAPLVKPSQWPTVNLTLTPVAAATPAAVASATSRVWTGYGQGMDRVWTEFGQGLDRSWTGDRWG
jgi:hypothetical protein